MLEKDAGEDPLHPQLLEQDLSINRDASNRFGSIVHSFNIPLMAALQPSSEAGTKVRMESDTDSTSAARLIDAKIAGLGDWRGAMLARMRRLIREADPAVIEEVKWRKPSNPAGVPVWSHGGIVCTGETYKDKVKLTFARGATLPDPSGLFNASLDAGTRRAIDLHEGDEVNDQAFEQLIRAAVAMNLAGSEK
jgi:hypothetical protein